MGYYDREYYRGEDSGFRIGEVTLVTQIVFVTVAFFIANLLFSGDDALTRFLALRAGDLARPQFWWRFLSYGFAHNPDVAAHIAMNMFVLWMFGREVEGIYGRFEILRFYLVSIVIGGLFWAAHNYALGRTALPLIGASGGVTAVFMLFVCNFPKRTILLFFILPVPAWLLGLLYVLMDIMGAHSSATTNVAYDVHLVGAAFAALYWYSGIRLNWLAPTSWWKGRKPFRRGPRLRVHKPQASSDADDYQALDQQADAVLDKVARDGIESLSAKERRVLEAYSRRMQQKHR